MMRKLRVGLLALAAMAASLSGGGTAEAQPAYSFEDAAFDGFFGLGAAVSQDTIGVTEGDYSLKYEVGVGGFVGARTESVIPANLNDPPGVEKVLFDVTIPEAYTDTFADIGITLFGHALNAPGGAEFGHQVQFSGITSLAALGVGTHTDVSIDLGVSVGSYRPGETFNEIFGDGPADLTVASAFQFFINKNVTTPITVYIDNVRLVVPEPMTATMLVGTALVLVLSSRRRS